MELPEFAYSVGFWVKFAICFGLFVIVPIFFMNFTGDLSFGKKLLYMIGGAVAVVFALNGKSIKYGKHKQR